MSESITTSCNSSIHYTSIDASDERYIKDHPGQMFFDFMKIDKEQYYEMIDQCYPYLPPIIDSCYAKLPDDQFEDILTTIIKQNKLAVRSNKQ